MNGNTQTNVWSRMIYNICFNTDESQGHFFSPSDWMLIIWPFSHEQSVVVCDLLQGELMQPGGSASPPHSSYQSSLFEEFWAQTLLQLWGWFCNNPVHPWLSNFQRGDRCQFWLPAVSKCCTSRRKVMSFQSLPWQRKDLEHLLPIYLILFYQLSPLKQFFGII